MKTRAVGYIRVSTEIQSEEGLSLDIQREEITEYCKDQKYKLIGIYEDAGISGATLDRPALLSLLDSAKEGEFDIVIVYRLDRLARDLFAELFIEKELEVSEVKLYSITEPDLNKSDPSTRLFRQIKGAFSEYEKELIRLRLTAGRLRKYKDGGYAGGGLALGYDSQRNGRSHSKLVINEAEAKIVKYIRKLKRRGLSLRAIAKRLNEEGYTTKRGCGWTHRGVQRILSNSLYRGKIKYAGEVRDGIQEPIVRGKVEV